MAPAEDFEPTPADTAPLPGVRDMALVVRGLLCARDGGGQAGPRQALREDAMLLPCGRLLRYYPEETAADCIGISNCWRTAPVVLDELRRPAAALLLAVEVSAEAEDLGSCEPKWASNIRCLTVKVPRSAVRACIGAGDLPGGGDAAGSADDEPWTWLSQVLGCMCGQVDGSKAGLLEQADGPVMLHAMPTGHRAAELLVDAVMVACLKALGLANDLARAACCARPGCCEATVSRVISACGGDCRVVYGDTAPELLRQALRGAGWGPGEEAAWLKEDVRLAHRLARESLDAEAKAGGGAGDRDGVTPGLSGGPAAARLRAARDPRSRFWCQELAAAAGELAEQSDAPGAAAALYYQGWALARLSSPVEGRLSLVRCSRTRAVPSALLLASSPASWHCCRPVPGLAPGV